METPGERRVFYQGMIQAAVAYYHASNGNGKGAAHLLERSMEKLEHFTPQCEGVDVQKLLLALKAHLGYFVEGLKMGSISLPDDCPKLGL